MDDEHHYTALTSWTENKGSGTSSYEAYERAHEITLGPDLHTQAHDKCYIANSVNFPVHVAGQFTHKQG